MEVVIIRHWRYCWVLIILSIEPNPRWHITNFKVSDVIWIICYFKCWIKISSSKNNEFIIFSICCQSFSIYHNSWCLSIRTFSHSCRRAFITIQISSNPSYLSIISYCWFWNQYTSWRAINCNSRWTSTYYTPRCSLFFNSDCLISTLTTRSVWYYQLVCCSCWSHWYRTIYRCIYSRCGRCYFFSYIFE